jgi:hypothetical protein
VERICLLDHKELRVKPCSMERKPAACPFKMNMAGKKVEVREETPVLRGLDDRATDGKKVEENAEYCRLKQNISHHLNVFKPDFIPKPIFLLLEFTLTLSHGGPGNGEATESP